MKKTNVDAVLSPKSLHYFLELINSMSYTQAAQVLGITQPALTQQIKKIENAVGAPLFVQVGKKLYLTDAGIEMQETANKLFNTVHGAIDTIQRYTQSDRGRIVIGILNIIESRVIENFLIQFNKKFPDIKIELTFYNRKELWDKLDKNEIDIGIFYLPDHHAKTDNMNQYATKKIYEESILPLSCISNTNFNAMLKGNWVSYPKDSYMTSVFERFYSSRFPVNGLTVRARFSRMNDLVRFARAINANTFVTKSFYQANRAKIELTPIRTKPDIKFSSFFVYRKSKSEIPRLFNFMKEWNKYIKEKDYASRLDEVETII